MKMLPNIFFRRFLTSCGSRKLTLHREQTYNYLRNIKTSCIVHKKRKSPEERAIENQGRRVIRYTPKSDKIVDIWRNMTVADVADTLKKDIDAIIESLSFADKLSSIDYKRNTIISDPQVLRDVIKICGYKYRTVAPPCFQVLNDKEENKDAVPQPPPPPENLRPRPPVVTVMGHVDHGKTTLLDALRNTSVVDQEFGGITQHIGAFSVRLKSGEVVTFLDTPGHAAFSAMRSRGAHHTDLVVLVVAADDGVMEQTVESIKMAQTSGVPMLVAINKIDKPGTDIKYTIESLAKNGVVVEALGGDVQAIPISALKRTNLDTLVEALILQAQVMDLKADPTGLVEGVVVEAEVDPKRGKQATVIVQRGTLRKGCVIVAGHGWAKVRLMLGSEGQTVTEAPPSTPVRVLGWKQLPNAGDVLLEVQNEKRANEVIKWREQKRLDDKLEKDLEVIQQKEAEHQEQYKAFVEKKRALGRFRLKREGPREKEIQQTTHPAVNVVIKGDVDGSVEAILDILETYGEDHLVKLDLVHFGVGQVTPNDIELAKTFNAIVYTFNVECPLNVAAEAKHLNVRIKQHNVIYKLFDDLKLEINEKIPSREEEEVVGEANVLQCFQINEGRKKVPVAGSRCTKGELARYAMYRIVRGQDVIYEGKLASMKHLKDEVDKIKKDMECGLRFAEDQLELQPGDTIVCYKMVQVKDKTQWDPGF